MAAGWRKGVAIQRFLTLVLFPKPLRELVVADDLEQTEPRDR